MTQPLHYAVVVGIDRYPVMQKPLRYARQDAVAFADWLRQEGGFDDASAGQPHPRIALILSPAGGKGKSPAEPVTKQIFDAVRDFFRDVEAKATTRAQWRQTRLYFYVSGHGIAPSARDACLLMADAGPEEYSRNVSCSALTEKLELRQSFHELVVFADCCREYADQANATGPMWDTIRRNFGRVRTVYGFATYFGVR